MASQIVREESTIPFSKVDTLKEYQDRLQFLFRVAVGFDSPHAASGIWWIHLEGQKTDVKDAKVFIKSLCNPEAQSRLPVTDFHHYELLDHARDVERETKAVVTFPSRNECLIRGSELNVAMAYSMIEQKVRDLKSVSSNPVAKSPRRDIEPALKDFAIKLGYTEQDISQVVRKLGADVDQNTLLHELIKISTSSPMQLSAQPRPQTEETRGYVPTSVPRRDRNPPQIVARSGAPAPKKTTAQNPGANLYGDRPGVYARGARPKASPPPNSAVPWPQYDHDRTVQHDPGLKERQEADKVYYHLLRTSDKESSSNKSDLRPIVVDGSNVAMSHGHQDIFSCKGIKLCVEFFQKRGHKEIYVFVPQWRKETPRQETPMTDQEILFSLEREGIVVYTPSRKLENGRRIVCYDDRFIVKLAAENEGIIVSNDNYRDLCNENPQWKEAIEHRLLMYSFVGDIFMVPDDPLGRHGPTLDDFMRKGTATQPRICPYLKRCTYGLRCRFYHPERDLQATQSTVSVNQQKVDASIPLKSASDAARKKIAVLKEWFPQPQLEPTIRRLVEQNPNRDSDWLVERMLERE